LPVDTRNFSLDFVVKSFLKAGDAPPELRHPLWLASVVPGSADDPLHPDLRRHYPASRVLAPATRAYEETGSSDPFQRLCNQYCKTYLAEDILTKLDRASMAVSLEARSVFLDHELVELITSLPSHYKYRRFETKRILRHAFRDRIPPSVLARKKKGFGFPVAECLKGPLRERALDLLAHDRIKRAGFLRAEVVSRLIEEHLRERRDNRKVLWTLLMFEMWRDQYGI
jgi:asparagine synthase (glutamine-hydrolysing)